MAEELNLFDSLNPDEPIIDGVKENNKSRNSYKVTDTDLKLDEIGERLSSKYKWITNSDNPYSASNIIKVKYDYDYDYIFDLYNKEKILTFRVGDTYTSWIKKSLKKKKTNHLSD